MQAQIFEDFPQALKFVGSISGVPAEQIDILVDWRHDEDEGYELLDMETMKPVIGTIDGQRVTFLRFDVAKGVQLVPQAYTAPEEQQYSLFGIREGE